MSIYLLSSSFLVMARSPLMFQLEIFIISLLITPFPSLVIYYLGGAVINEVKVDYLICFTGLLSTFSFNYCYFSLLSSSLNFLGGIILVVQNLFKFINRIFQINNALYYLFYRYKCINKYVQKMFEN